MKSQATTLGQFVAELMEKHQHTNRSLAEIAGVSEGAIRNLLKSGIDPNAKDPDARTLARVATALDTDAIHLFRLAGYIPPAPDANSPRAEYLADVFDQLPPEKQDAVLGVLEAMAEKPAHKASIQEMRDNLGNPLAGLDLNFPGLLRNMANQLIVKYGMTEPFEGDRIEPDVFIVSNRWGDLPRDTQERIRALIRRKLSLDYDPTMVDQQWRK